MKKSQRWTLAAFLALSLGVAARSSAALELPSLAQFQAAMKEVSVPVPAAAAVQAGKPMIQKPSVKDILIKALEAGDLPTFNTWLRSATNDELLDVYGEAHTLAAQSSTPGLRALRAAMAEKAFILLEWRGPSPLKVPCGC
ncbi:MAG: hypothetical protein Q7T82_20200 [Armatimonadota bacterium]|nr:hypothetical protein [Armatimonadota bacterium]